MQLVLILQLLLVFWVKMALLGLLATLIVLWGGVALIRCWMCCLHLLLGLALRLLCLHRLGA